MEKLRLLAVLDDLVRKLDVTIPTEITLDLKPVLEALRQWVQAQR